MNIIISGGCGFIGANLKKKLISKHNVKIISVRYLLNQKFEFETDAIIHLAGMAHDLKNNTSFNHYYLSNTELTKQIFDSFLISKSKIFIFMSSVKAVVDNTDKILSEIEIALPKSNFGKSKLLAENYILSKEIPKGKKIFILRPCMIHGPGNKGNLNLLYQLVSKRFPWPLGAFHNQRSFCNIDNVCYVINQILERDDIPSGVYNLADDETLSTNELIELIASSTNRKARIFSIPKKLIYTIAKIGDVLYLPLNTERLDKLTENFVVSNLKIKAVLGIEKLPVTSKEGLVKTFKSFTK